MKPPMSTPQCREHQCPKIQLQSAWYCPIQRLFDHIGQQPVRDVIPSHDDIATNLVFGNGHTLPLYCPSCGAGIELADQEEDAFIGRYFVGAEFDVVQLHDGRLVDALFLYFSSSLTPGTDGHGDTMQICLHLDSARLLTCPNEVSPAAGPASEP
jgi:hypothetical protein